MGIGIDLLLDEYRHLEMLMCDLYIIFRGKFPEDADFWWMISQEEMNHASLIMSVKEAFVPLGKIPSFVEKITFETVFNENQKAKSVIEDAKTRPISREEAFKMALELENSAMEQHYQEFMQESDSGAIDEIFQKLNGCDKDHAQRIKDYAMRVGISLE